MKDRDKWYIIPDHHPAIVEKSVFEKVQTSQLRFSQPNKKKRDYPLKGKAFCGCCGHALSRTMQKTSYYAALCRNGALALSLLIPCRTPAAPAGIMKKSDLNEAVAMLKLIAEKC